MSRSTKVTIIIPVYNGSEFIRRCFDSCIYQTLQDIEIIAVNDCSPNLRDGEIMLEYEELYPGKFRAIFHKINKRQGGARNTGILAAQGEYVLCVDQDDYIDLEMCEKMYETTILENLDMVMCGFNYFSRGDIVYYSPALCNEENFRKYVPTVWKILVKKKFILGNGVLFPENVVTDDVVSILWFMITEKYCFVDKPFYNWIRHNNAESTIVTYRYCISVPMSFKDISTYETYLTLSDKKKETFSIVATHHLYGSLINCMTHHPDQLGELCSAVREVLQILKPNFNHKVFFDSIHGKIVSDTLQFVAENPTADNLSDMFKKHQNALMGITVGTLIYSNDTGLNNKNELTVIWGAGIRGRRLAGYLKEVGLPFEITDSKSTIWGEDVYGSRIRPWSELENSAQIVIITPKNAYDEIKASIESNNIKIFDYKDLI